MMFEFKFHPDIYNEVKETFDCYESKSVGLGEDFLNELDEAFSVIQSMPRSWHMISNEFRRYLLKRFPFGVIYSLEDNYIYVVAVMHLSRKPDYWIKRISKC